MIFRFGTWQEDVICNLQVFLWICLEIMILKLLLTTLRQATLANYLSARPKDTATQSQFCKPKLIKMVSSTYLRTMILIQMLLKFSVLKNLLVMMYVKLIQILNYQIKAMKLKNLMMVLFALTIYYMVMLGLMLKMIHKL